LTELSADNLSPGHHQLGQSNDAVHDIHHSPDVELKYTDHAHALDALGSHAAQEPSNSSEPHAAVNATVMANSVPVTESPAPLDPAMQPADGYVDENHSAASLSYPGAFQGMDGSIPSTPIRNMTYPDTAAGAVASGKKFKCEDCNAEFTRHHNLKSHQLTHSKDKPFMCPNCDMRFRRLHDLKRHGKLHTGEKSYKCDKCGRGFARGDALVRHNKGVMGCSTARNSVGGSGEDGGLEGGNEDGSGGDDTGMASTPTDPAMAGLMFAHDGTSAGTSHDDQRRLSLPAQIKAQQHARGFSSAGRNSMTNTYMAAGPSASAAHQTFAPTANMVDSSPKPIMANQGPSSQVSHRPNKL